MLIAILYCIGDIEAALSTPTGYPFIEIFTYATRSASGGTAVSALIIVMFGACAISTLASASRQLWAFSRDNAVPNARMVAYVHPKMKVPVASIGITCLISALLSIINVGSTTVFNAVVSLTVSGFFCSYILPFSFLLHKRVTKSRAVSQSAIQLGQVGLTRQCVGDCLELPCFVLQLLATEHPCDASEHELEPATVGCCEYLRTCVLGDTWKECQQGADRGDTSREDRNGNCHWERCLVMQYGGYVATVLSPTHIHIKSCALR